MPHDIFVSIYFKLRVTLWKLFIVNTTSIFEVNFNVEDNFPVQSFENDYKEKHNFSKTNSFLDNVFQSIDLS